MPFTPFHLGPGLVLGLLLFSWLHLPTFLMANMIPDIEPFYVILSGGGAHHGFFHSFAGAGILAVLLGAAMLLLDPWVKRAAKPLGLEQKATKRSVFAAAFFGVFLHVAIDSILYTDMHPFWPADANPFFVGGPAFTAVYVVTGVLFLLGSAILLGKRKH